ncbi:MAG: hypothetical protein M3Y12_07080 [Bacteroidota bacterium]|nr:hypothetical protein [Bacteroidota bacterium]
MRRHGRPVHPDGVHRSLRALVQYIDHLTDAEVATLDIPTGRPLVYELDGQLNRLRHYYLE